MVSRLYVNDGYFACWILHDVTVVADKVNVRLLTGEYDIPFHGVISISFLLRCIEFQRVLLRIAHDSVMDSGD